MLAAMGSAEFIQATLPVSSVYQPLEQQLKTNHLCVKMGLQCILPSISGSIPGSSSLGKLPYPASQASISSSIEDDSTIGWNWGL